MKKGISTILPMLCILANSLNAQQHTATAGESGERTLSADSLITADGRLDSLYRTLPEVMVTGQRPVVKAEQGKLVYDLPRLMEGRPVDNAYEALKELPGVVEMNGGLTLAGQSVTVMIDGKATNLDASQLAALLQSMPAGRMAQAEVMYSAPARYQVRGALINLTLNRSEGEGTPLQAEAYGKYEQSHEASFEERASLLWGIRRLSLDLLYSHVHGDDYSTTGKEALHTLADGTIHPVNTDETSRGRNHTHNFRIGADYDIAPRHRLNFVYTGRYETSHNRNDIRGFQQSLTRHEATDWLHDGRLDYQAPFGLKAGVELTHYQAPSNQLVDSHIQEEVLLLQTEESQRINRWRFYLSQEHDLKHGWGLNYGAVYTNSLDNSRQQYHRPDDATSPEVALPATDDLATHDMRSRRREETFNLYLGGSKVFGTLLTVEASVAVERYQTPQWKQWNCYPTLNLSYMPADGHIVQLALNSDKQYPDYWAVQDATTYLSSYSEIVGNPLLTPAQEYELRLTYILKGRYIFGAWFTHTDNYATQTLYQSPDRLVEIYKYLNFDFRRQAGLQASVPFRIKRLLDSRLTLMGLWDREKDSDFWTLPFDRNVCYLIATMNNTVTLSTRPDLKLTLSGMVHTRAMQGIYDLPASGNLDLGLRYGFASGKGILSLYCNDLFETGQISPRIRYRTQHVTNHYSCFRQVGLSLTWKLGGYKEKEREAVDTSRFK